jgi:hypothetical protein
MKPFYYLYLLFVIVFTLSSCTSGRFAITPISTATSLPSSTFMPPTSPPTLTPTITPSPIPTATPTRLPTLTPAEARETIKTLLQKPVDCAAPCFWGIVPGQSTFAEAVRAITHFGLQLLYTNTLDNRDFRESKYDFDSGLSISPLLAIQNDVVENITVYIDPEKQKTGVPREWLAYSPQTLINRYGLPSRVEFSGDRGNIYPLYVMVLYFDTHHLIVEYDSHNLGQQLQICPLTDQIEPFRIWMGKDPYHPPFEGTPLEKATSMTMEEFSKLMTGPFNKACFDLKEETFP